MSMVDNRVVRMTFDNSQFEKNVKTTMETLTEFEKKLKFDGAAAGLDTIKSAADKLNLSVLGDKAGDEAKRIAKMSSDASDSIDKIDDKASSADFSPISDAAAKAVDGVNRAADGVDMTSLTESANDAASDINMAIDSVDLGQIDIKAQLASAAFQALETVATGALLGIGNAIQNEVMSKLNGMKNALVGPIADGFKEYETQIGSIQTILANTGMDFDSDEDIQLVNDTLDELNTYADETIYNFTEMTRAIGTFTSSGMGLEEAKNAVQGAANVAALAGAGGSELTRVLPQLAQALSAGSVSQQDWMSIQTAHMDSRLFVEAIGDMAVHMAEAGKAEESAYIAGQRILEEGANMRTLLNKVDSKDISGWFSSDILGETLQVFTYDLNNMEANERAAVEEHLKELGYTTKEEIEGIAHLAEMAKRAAQEVRTWTQLKDTLSEGIGSAWSGIWRNFIGDFKQATDNFTFLSTTLSDGVDGLLGGLVHAFQIFNRYEDSEGNVFRVIEDFWGKYKRYQVGDIVNGEVLKEGDSLIGQKVIDSTTHDAIRIKGAFDYLVEAITKPLGAIKDAFDNVFGMGDAELFQVISSLVLAFKDFAQTLVISDNAATGLRHIFEGLFSILHVAIIVVMDLGAAFFGVIDILRIFIDPIIDIALAIGGQLGKAILWIHDKFMELREAVIYTIYPLLEMGGAFGDVIRSAFGFIDIPGKIEAIGDTIGMIMEFLWELIDLPGKIGLIGDALRGIFDFVGKILDPIFSLFKGIGDAIVNIISHTAGLKDSIAKALGFGGKDAKAPSGVFEELSNIVSNFMSLLGGVGSAISSAFGAVGSFIVPVFTAIINFLKMIAMGIGGGILFIFSTLASIFKAFGSALIVVGKAIKGAIDSGLPTFLRLVGQLKEAISGFATRMWEFIKSWEPIQGLVKIISDFKNKVLGFFTGAPKQIEESGNSIAGSISNTNNWMTKFVETFEAVISYINKLSPDKFMNDVTSFFTNLAESIPNAIVSMKDKFTTAIENFLSIDPSAIANIIAGVALLISGAISNLAYTLEMVLFNLLPPGLYMIVTQGIGAILKPIKTALDWIATVAIIAKENSSNIPEFIISFIAGLGTIIFIGLQNLALTIVRTIVIAGVGIGIALKNLGTLIFDAIYSISNGEGLSGIKDSFKKFVSNIKISLLNAFDNLGPSFSGVKKSIFSFFSKLSDDKDGIKNAIAPLIDKIKDEFKTMIPEMSKIFDTLKETIKDSVSHLPSIVSQGLTSFRDVFLNAMDSITTRLSRISGPIGDFFGGLHDSIIMAKADAKKISVSFPTSLNSIGKSIWNFIKNTGNTIKDFFMGVEGDDENIGFLERIKSFFASKLGAIPDGIGALFDSIIKIFNPERIKKIVNIVTIVAKVKLYKSLRELFSGLGKLSSAFARRISKEDAQTLEDKVRQWAISLAIMAGALWVVSTIKDPIGAVGIIASMGVILLALQGLSGIIQNKLGDKLGDDLMKAAASIGILAIGMMLMLKAVEALNGFDYAANWKGLVAFAAFITLFGFWTRSLGDGGKNAHKAALAMVIMAVALRLLIKPIEDITELVKDKTWGELGKIGAGLGALALFILAMGAALNIAGKNALKNSIAFLIMAASISIIGDAIAKLAFLAMLNIDAVKIPFLGMLALISAFAIMAAKVKTGDLLKTSAALLIFSASITVLAYGIGILAGQSWESIAVASAGIVALLGALYFMTTKLKAGDLVKTSLALLAYGAALGIMCLALSSLAAVGPGLTPAAIALGAIVGIFGILAVALSSPAISAGATKVLPLLSLAFIALGAASLMIAIALNKAVEGIVKMAMVSPILVQFVSVISQNALQFGVAALALGAFGAALMIFGPGAVLAGAGLLLLSEGIRSFLMLIIELPILLQLAAESIGFMISQIPVMLGTIWENVSTWFTESFLPMLQEMIPQIMDFLTNLATQAWDWLQTTGIPLLKEYGGKFWDWFKSDALPKLGEAVKGLMGKLGELATLLMGWLQNEGWPFLKKLAGDFWHWFTTEGLPKIGEAIPKVMDKLGELLSALGSWVVNDGLPAAGKAVADMVGKAKDDLGPKIKDFINDLPGHLKSAIDSIWSSIQGIGGNIVQGISEGISGGVQWIINAVNGLGGDALNAIKNFFGIASPSKLMRDEIGQYIPEGLGLGITKFSRYATDAAENLGKDSIDSINSVMNNADYATLSPSISPVMNMDNFAGNVADYNRLIRSTMLADSADIDRKFSGEMALSSDLANRLDNDISAMDTLTGAIDDIRQMLDSNVSKTEDLYSKTNSLLESIGGDASSIRNSLTSGMGLYLDKSTLIGAIAPEMDTRLGQRAILAGRGVY